MFQGSWLSVYSPGTSGNTFHFARYGFGAGDASAFSVPVYVVGAAQPPPSGKSQTLIS